MHSVAVVFSPFPANCQGQQYSKCPEHKPHRVRYDCLWPPSPASSLLTDSFFKYIKKKTWSKSFFFFFPIHVLLNNSECFSLTCASFCQLARLAHSVQLSQIIPLFMCKCLFIYFTPNRRICRCHLPTQIVAVAITARSPPCVSLLNLLSNCFHMSYWLQCSRYRYT